MTGWTKAELRRMGDKEEMRVSPLERDGVSYATPKRIWSVVVQNALYVRAYNGQRSRWYQAAMRRKAGRVAVGELTKTVCFEPVDGSLDDDVDHAYRTKYRNSPYLLAMISTRARSATLRIAPCPEQNRMNLKQKGERT
jgi:hypothetical protein